VALPPEPASDLEERDVTKLLWNDFSVARDKVAHLVAAEIRGDRRWE
jgi:hypothetical protein